MTTIRKSFSSGYAIDKVYSTSQQFRDAAPSAETADHGGMRFGWDWRWLKDHTFEVKITVEIELSPARPEFVSTDVVGRFRQLKESPGLSVEDFAKLQAVAILLPYARQYLSMLTLNSQHGAYYLPSLNVTVLMEGFSPDKTTAMRQKAETNAPGAGAVAIKRTPAGRVARKKR
jgi:preprotein translocase subunit SecB